MAKLVLDALLNLIRNPVPPAGCHDRNIVPDPLTVLILENKTSPKSPLFVISLRYSVSK